MIRTDPHGGTILLTYLHKRRELFPYAVKFGIVCAVGILQYFEPLFVGIVAWVDAHLLHNAGGKLSGVGCKVNIGNQQRMVPAAPQFLADNFQVSGFLDAGRCETNVLTTRFDHANGLLYGTFRVHGIHGGHRLHPYGIIPPKGYVSYFHLNGAAPAVSYEIIAILPDRSDFLIHTIGFEAKLIFKNRLHRGPFHRGRTVLLTYWFSTIYSRMSPSWGRITRSSTTLPGDRLWAIKTASAISPGGMNLSAGSPDSFQLSVHVAPGIMDVTRMP